MSRLTEQELDLIEKARRLVHSETTDVDSALAESRHLRATAVVRFIAHAADVFARVTGLKLLSETVVRPIRNAMKRRATLGQLYRLNDRMLEDIGLDRGTILGYAENVSAGQPGEPKQTLFERFRSWRQVRATVRELEALNDHLLADIGLQRAEIAETVKAAGLAETQGAARPNRVKDLVEQIDRSAADSYHRTMTREISRRIARLENEVPKVHFHEVRA